MQKDHGLKVDGIVGSATAAIIDGAPSQRGPAPVQPAPTSARPSWLLAALGWLGTKEQPGSGDNPVILKWAKDTGVAGIVARPTPELLTLQQALIAAVAPFTVETGPIGAFTASHDDPTTDALLISYVATFVPQQTGEHFNPHVSTGVAPKEYLDKMIAEPFELFTFSPAGAAVYQLGPFGTAAKKLKEWDLKR